jgi:hypothetical protein
MGLSGSVIDRILELLLGGAVPAPQNPPVSGPVFAVMELLAPALPGGPEALAEQATRLYEQHERFTNLRPQIWLSRLEQLAETKLRVMPEKLEQVLQAHLNSHWIVVDCLGLPLLETVKNMLPDCFPQWRFQAAEFGLLSEQSSTEAFYLGLLGRDFRKAFEKINSVDALIHDRNLGFRELERLARAELEIAFKKLNPQLDPSLPLIIFGDHGFRLTPDGNGFSHGGPSTLERIVPVFLLGPI